MRKLIAIAIFMLAGASSVFAQCTIIVNPITGRFDCVGGASGGVNASVSSGSAVTSLTINHNLNTLAVVFDCYSGASAPFTPVTVTSISAQTVNSITLNFASTANVTCNVNGTGGVGPAGPTGATGSTGATGAAGNTVLNGSGTPSSGTGNNGDFYLQNSNCMWGPKAAGAWPGSCTSLVGPTGATGATGATGNTGPVGPAGNFLTGWRTSAAATDTVANTDMSSMVQHSNSAAAVTIPACPSSGVALSATYTEVNTGTGTVTVTPASGTIQGAANLAVGANQWALIECGVSGDWKVAKAGSGGNLGVQSAGTTIGTRPNLNFTNSGTGITISAADNPGASRVDVTTSVNTAVIPNFALLQAKGWDLLNSTNGTTNYSACPNPTIGSSSFTGATWRLVVDTANTITQPTLQTCTGSIRNITMNDGTTVPPAGTINPGQMVWLYDDGSVYRLVSPNTFSGMSGDVVVTPSTLQANIQPNVITIGDINSSMQSGTGTKFCNTTGTPTNTGVIVGDGNGNCVPSLATVDTGGNLAAVTGAFGNGSISGAISLDVKSSLASPDTHSMGWSVNTTNPTTDYLIDMPTNNPPGTNSAILTTGAISSGHIPTTFVQIPTTFAAIPSGTSGAIAAFTSSSTVGTPSTTTTLDSSGNISAAGTVKAGTPPSGVTGVTSGTGGVWIGAEGTAPTGNSAGTSILQFSSAAHNLLAYLNGASSGSPVGIFTGSITGSKCLQTSGTAGLVTEAAAACGTGSGGSLSTLTAATGTNTIANGNNFDQIWNWALTTNSHAAITFGETTAATSGTLGNQYIHKLVTLAGSTAVPLNVTSSLTGSQTLPSLHITPTWNTTGVVDAALLVNVTNTASGAASKLFDAQVGGTSEFNVDKAGIATAAATVIAGTAPSGTFGTGGGLISSEGTDVTGASNQDDLVALSSQHAYSVNNNNTGSMPISRAANVNITPVTVSTSTTSDQNLMSVSLNANLLNVAGRTFRVVLAGVYSNVVTSAPTVTLKLKLCTVSGCGSGTVITPLSIASTATSATAVTNLAANITGYISTVTAGASSTYEAHGNLTIDLGTTNLAADSIFADTNTATVGTIDSTGALFLQAAVAFSAASASNSFTARQLIVEVLN